jgi:signal transduction histidine kinase
MPEPQEEPLDLSELARNCGALHETQDVQLRVACDTRAPVRGDRLLLSRVVHNLLVNAFEASPSQGVVELETASTGARRGWRCATAGPVSTPRSPHGCSSRT